MCLTGESFTETARSCSAWKRAKAQAELSRSKQKRYKSNTVRGSRLLPEDWTCIMVQFKAKHGNDPTDDELPAQAYTREISQARVRQVKLKDQDRAKPESARQYGFHLDPRLTLQTRRKYTSSHPKDIEQTPSKCTTSCLTCGFSHR